jgi:hypothetical protein
MRQLTKKQKNLLDKFFESRKQTPDQEFMSGSVFKGGDHSIGIDELFKHDDELFAKLEEINDTEILHQEVNRYLDDKSSDYIHKRR